MRVGVGARGCSRENERVGWKDGRRAGGGLRRRARRAGVRESIAAGCNARGVVQVCSLNVGGGELGRDEVNECGGGCELC